MLIGRLSSNDQGTPVFVFETSSLVEAASISQTMRVREKLSALIAAVDLERATSDRSHEVNKALAEASLALFIEGKED